MSSSRSHKLDGYRLLQLTGLALPEAVCCASVCGLNLSGTDADHLMQFTNLRRLDASCNALALADLATLPALEELSLASNGIREADDLRAKDSASRLSRASPPPPPMASLTDLDLSHNFLGSEAAASLSRMGALRRLSLARNRLGASPLPDFSGFAALRALSLAGNRRLGRDTPGLMRGLGALRRLVELDLSGCGVTRLPDELPGFGELARLILADNRVEEERAVAPLAALPRLHFLDLRRNPLVARGGPLPLLTALLVERCQMDVRVADPDAAEAVPLLSTGATHALALAPAPAPDPTPAPPPDPTPAPADGHVPAFLLNADAHEPAVDHASSANAARVRALGRVLSSTREPPSRVPPAVARAAALPRRRELMRRENERLVEGLRAERRAAARPARGSRKSDTVYGRMSSVLDAVEREDARIAARVRNRREEERAEQDALALMETVSKAFA